MDSGGDEPSLMSAALLVGGRSGAERSPLKRGRQDAFGQITNDATPASSTERERNDRIKRARFEIYKGYEGLNEQDRTTFVMAFTTWVARTHGFTFLKDPETALPRFTSFPPNLAGITDIPHWLWAGEGPGSPSWLPRLSIFPPETCPEKDEQMQIIDAAVGQQSQSLMLGLLVSMAALSAVIDGENTLSCRYCQTRAGDATGAVLTEAEATQTANFLLTIAREHVPSCRNPLVASSASRIAWASSFFESEPIVKGQDRRQGEAVCLKCLYRHVISKDEELMQVITLLPMLKQTYHANEAKLATARRVCACRHPERDQPGTLCLFSFSRVLPRSRAALKTAAWDRTLLPAFMKQLIRQEDFDDSSYSFPVSDPRLGSLVQAALFSPSSPILAYHGEDSLTVPAAEESPLDLHPLDEDPMILDTDVFDPAPTLSPTLPPPPAPSPPPPSPLPSLPTPVSLPTEAGSGVIPCYSSILIGLLPPSEYRKSMPPDQHVALIREALPWVKAYFESLQYLGSTLPMPLAAVDPALLQPSSGENVAKRKSKSGRVRPAPKVSISTSTTLTAEEEEAAIPPARGLHLALSPTRREEEAQICPLCGGAGHKIAKTCPFFVPEDGFKPRDGLNKFEHMADNVESHMKDSRGEVGKLLEKMAERVTSLGELAVEWATRDVAGHAQRRGGPRPEDLPPPAPPGSTTACTITLDSSRGPSQRRGKAATPPGHFHCPTGVALLLPSAELETLLAIPLERYSQLLALDYFFNPLYIGRAVIQFSRAGMQVNDLFALYGWVVQWREERGVDASVVFSQFSAADQVASREALFQFYQQLSSLLAAVTTT
jgi:hypothetical protein